MDPELNCSHCNQEYSEENPPRLLTHCGHTFCEQCLLSLALPEANSLRILCPEDQKVLQLSSTVQNLPKNLALMKYLEGRQRQTLQFREDSSFQVSKITKNESSQEDEDAKELITVMHAHQQHHPKTTNINSSNSQNATQSESGYLLPDQPQTQLCLLHQKPVQVICLNDMQRLCSKCAIFGQHKGHDFRSVQQIESDNKKYYKEIISLFQQKENYKDGIGSRAIQQELLSILANNSSKLKKDITDKYKRMAEELIKAEKVACKKLQEVVRTVQKKIKRLLTIDSNLRTTFDTWEASSLQKIKLSEAHTQDGTLSFYLEAKDIVLRGQSILLEFRRQEEKALASAQQLIAHLRLTFQDSACLAALNSLVQVHEQDEDSHRKSFGLPITAQSKQNNRHFANQQSIEQIKSGRNIELKHESDESLLQADEFEYHKSPVVAITHYLDESFEKVELPKFQNLSKSVAVMPQIANTKRFTQKNTKSPVFTKQTEKHRQVVHVQSALGRESLKKKTKNIKVPEKYEKIIEGILTDTLQTIDLTNAELGDAVITQICQLIKNNTKSKTLKLIRNKLTDQGLAKLLPLLTGISTLNLSQNALTEQSLNIIATLRCSLPNLRAIILSQNKIAERKSRAIVQKLRKMELTISI